MTGIEPRIQLGKSIRCVQVCVPDGPLSEAISKKTSM